MTCFLRILAHLGIAGALLGIILGLLQNYHPAMDSFSHFRLHFVAVLVLVCSVLAFVSKKRERAFAVLLVVIGGAWLAFEFSKGPPENSERGDLRLVQFNLNYRNQVLDQVGQALVAYDADVVALQEVTRTHEDELRILTAYPHQAHCYFRDYVGGVSILSKHRLSAINCAKGQGLVTAQVDAPGGAVTVGSIHTLWPWPFPQHGQVDNWAAELRKISGPTIITGDFNAAAWSHAVSKVEQASRATVVPGIRMTIGLKIFPVFPPVPIPIDHTLLTDDFCVISTHVGGPLGSDHYPTIVEIARADSNPAQRCATTAR